MIEKYEHVGIFSFMHTSYDRKEYIYIFILKPVRKKYPQVT